MNGHQNREIGAQLHLYHVLFLLSPLCINSSPYPISPCLYFFLIWREDEGGGELFLSDKKRVSLKQKSVCVTGVCARVTWPRQDEIWQRFALHVAECIYWLNLAGLSGARRGGRVCEGKLWSEEIRGSVGKWEHKSSEWDTWVSKQNYALNITISNKHCHGLWGILLYYCSGLSPEFLPFANTVQNSWCGCVSHKRKKIQISEKYLK